MSQTHSTDYWLKPPSFLQLPTWAFRLVLLCVVLIGAWIRVWGLGSHSPIIFEGHEANYLAYFEHAEYPNVGDTACYPAMQWWWYFWGTILPHTDLAALSVSIAAGLTSILVLSDALRILKGETWSALILALLLCTHPLHMVWSTSIYNVMPPFLFLCLGLYCLVRSRGYSWILSLLSGLCLGIAVSMRIEVGISALMFIGLSFYLGQSLLKLGGLLSTSGLFILLCTGQTLMSNDIPGSGEHLLALGMNIGLDDFWAPYSGFGILFLWAIAVYFQPANQRRLSVFTLLFLGLYHFVMASFNDYGSRHTLPALIVLLTMLALMRPWWLSVLLVLGVHLPALFALQLRYHAEPEDFFAYAQSEYSALKSVSEYTDSCVLINENPPFAGERVYSHFNLWDTSEFERLESEFGCVNWCMDVHDWRWSSLGVHDRATRIQRLYQTEGQLLLNVDQNLCVLFRLYR